MTNFATVNARSILPKMQSFIDMSESLDLDFCLLNETWLKDSMTGEENKSDLELGSNIGIIHRNRGEEEGAVLPLPMTARNRL